jgi:hypothetical protein
MPIRMQIAGDASGVARKLLTLIQAKADSPANACWWQENDLSETDLPLMLPGGLSPRALCRCLDTALPANRAMALDGGHFSRHVPRDQRRG